MGRILLFAFAIAAAVLFPIGVSDAATIAADYQLQDTLDSSVGTIGPLTVVGPSANVSFADDTVNGNPQRVLNISNPAGLTADQSGVQSQTAGFLDPANYSIVLLASFQFFTTDPVATKIFDFKNLSSDAGLYVNAVDGSLAFIDGSGVIQGAGGALVNATYGQIVLTRDSSTKLTTVYENGVFAFSFTDTSGLAVMGDSSASGNAFLTLYKDDGAGIGGSTLDEGTVGNIARLRLYDGPLTAEEVAALDTTVVPEPSTMSILLLGGIVIGGARFFRRKN